MRRRSGTAADNREAFDRRATVSQCVQPLAKAEADSFQYGLRQGTAIGAGREAEEHALRMWIVVRRALATEVGQETLGLARLATGLSGSHELRNRAETERGCCPLDCATSTQHDGHLVPAPRQRMTEGVRLPSRMRAKGIVGEKDHA